MTEWHTIKGFNRDFSYEANKEEGVDLPECGKNVLVIYPEISKTQVFPKKSSSSGMDGTSYYDGTMWAYFDMPEI